MDIKEIEKIYNILMDMNLTEEDKINNITSNYNINNLKEECAAKDMYADMATQFYLSTIEERINTWEEMHKINNEGKAR